MALSATFKASVQTASASTSRTLTGVTFAAGSMGVVLIAYSNSGGGGSTCGPAASITDSKGNTWTLRLNTLYDPGSANAGGVNAVYTAPIDVALASGDTVVFTCSTAAISCLTAYQISSDIGGVDYVASASGAGSSTALPTVTTSSIPTGDLVIGFNNVKLNSGPTSEDTDTVNGTWSAAQKSSVAQPRQLTSQYKVVTGTGTQTFNNTFASATACFASWAQFTETAGPTVVEADGESDGIATDSVVGSTLTIQEGESSAAGSVLSNVLTAAVIAGATLCSGLTTASADSSILFTGTGSSTGVVITANVDISVFVCGVGSSSGSSTTSAESPLIVESVGSASGTSTADAISQIALFGDANSSGTSAVQATGSGYTISTASSAGTGTAAAGSISLFSGVAATNGTSGVSGHGDTSGGGSSGEALGIATATAVPAPIGTGLAGANGSSISVAECIVIFTGQSSSDSGSIVLAEGGFGIGEGKVASTAGTSLVLGSGGTANVVTTIVNIHYFEVTYG